MFSLNEGHRYFIYTKPVDMRKSFYGLEGIVTNEMGMNARSGDVYIFVNAGRKMIKLLHKEKGGMVIYVMKLDLGRVKLPYNCDEADVLGSNICYQELLSMIQAAQNTPYVRRLQLAALSFVKGD